MKISTIVIIIFVSLTISLTSINCIKDSKSKHRKQETSDWLKTTHKSKEVEKPKPASTTQKPERKLVDNSKKQSQNFINQYEIVFHHNIRNGINIPNGITVKLSQIMVIGDFGAIISIDKMCNNMLNRDDIIRQLIRYTNNNKSVTIIYNDDIIVLPLENTMLEVRKIQETK